MIFIENELLYGESGEASSDPDYLVQIGKAKVVKDWSMFYQISYTCNLIDLIERN